MATTIFNFEEPNGLGMFSQAGRVTSARHAIFRKKDEIFNNQKRVIKVTALPALALDISKKENQPKRLKEELEERSEPTPGPQAPKKAVIPPFARQLTREEVNKVKERKTTTPTHGLYTPKFTSIERSTSIMISYDKQKPRPMSSSIARPVAVNEEELTKPLADKPKRKVLGAVFFKHQTARGSFLTRAGTQCEQKTTDQLLGTPPLFRTRTTGSVRPQNRPNRNSYSSRHSMGSFSINRALTFGSPKGQVGSSGPTFTQTQRTLRRSDEKPFSLGNSSPKNSEEKLVEGEQTAKGAQVEGEFTDLLFFTQKRPSSRMLMKTPSDKMSEIKKCSEDASEEEEF